MIYIIEVIHFFNILKDYISYKLLSAIRMINGNIRSDLVLLYLIGLTGDNFTNLKKEVKIVFSEDSLHFYSKIIENFLITPII